MAAQLLIGNEYITIQSGPGPQCEGRNVRARMISAQTSRVILCRMARLIDEGHLRVIVGKIFLPGNVRQAHEYSRKHIVQLLSK